MENILREKLIIEDSFAWKLPTTGNRHTIHCKVGSKEGEVLRYVGGVGISFSKDDQSKAYGTLVVFDFHTLQVLY